MKRDNNRILSGGDMQDVIIYNSSGVSLAGKARVTSVGMDIDAQGQMFAVKKNSITFHISDFQSIMATGEKFNRWKASFVNSQNETVIGFFGNPLIDKTLDYVVATLTDIKSVTAV
jgi:hypothetical protein